MNSGIKYRKVKEGIEVHGVREGLFWEMVWMIGEAQAWQRDGVWVGGLELLWR